MSEDRLNYHHLLHFWAVAREGSVSAAGRSLRLSQPTISAQVRQLEERLGARLFSRVGRRLQLTDTGRTAFRYADEIFGLGRELVDAVHRGAAGRRPRLVVGVVDVVHKLIAYRMIEPALHLPGGVSLECGSDKLERLIPRLTSHELDLVLSDAPVAADRDVRAYNHPLGRSEVVIFAPPAQAPRLRRGFPRSLHGAPFLLPTSSCALRRELERWFERHEIRPDIVGEFEDSGLLKVFSQAGVGAFAGPAAIAAEIARQYRVQPVARAEGVAERYFAISAERRVRHPGVLAIAATARAELFGA